MNRELIASPFRDLRRRGRGVSRETIAAPLRDLRRWTAANPDLALLSGLLVLTACFGRPFSKLGGGGIYVTEIVLAATVVVAVRRTGVRGAIARIRAAVPLLALGLFWLAGAIAAVRGVADYGLDSTIKDVGLVEYSLFLPLVALVADTRPRADTLLRVLSYAGLAATIIFAFVFFFAPDTAIGVAENPTSAVGIYLALYVLPVTARLIFGERPRTWELVIGAAALVLMAFEAGRSVLVALAAALVVLVALSPRPARTAAVGAAAIALSIGGVVALQSLGFFNRGLEEPPKVLSVTMGSSLVLEDDLGPAFGGTVIDGYASEGTRSRELQVNHRIVLPFVNGLIPGETYTISFDVMPLDPNSVRGVVGNNGATGWGFVFWTVKPDRTWQHVVTRLTATQKSERLIIAPDMGTLGARFDAVRITRGSAPPPGDANDRETPVAVPDPDTRVKAKDSSLLSAIVDSFNPDAATGEFQNANWRLDYWNYLVRKTVDHPAFGVGFGKPAAFEWALRVYDTRDGGPESVSPPHNSFVNILYRTGLLGFAALVALFVIAVVRTLRLIRASAREERPPVVALLALAAFIVVIASLNVALEGPYMAMFFWTVVGLMLVLPALSLPPAPRRGPSED